MPSGPPDVKVYTTPANPMEVSVEVNVKSDLFAEQPWEDRLVYSNMNPDGSVTKGVKYNKLVPFTPQDFVKRFGSYVLTATENRYEGFISLLFAKDKTSDVDGDPNNPNTPVTTNIETRDGIYWNPVLKELRFIPVSYGFSQTGFTNGIQGVQTAQRYLIRQVYIPGTSKGTRVITRVFQSPVPFQIPQWDVPTPTEVSFHYINLSGGFPSCLHKRLNLQDLLGGTGFSGPIGSSANNYELIVGQDFPATNFIDWDSYIPEDSQKLVNGVWVRTQVEYSPPDKPETILSIS